MSSQSIVKWTYVIHFHIGGSFFLTIFCTSFWKRVHDSKEIVNLQGLFILGFGYVGTTTYPLTKNSAKRVYFIYKFFMFLLFIGRFSFLVFLYAVLWKKGPDLNLALSVHYLQLRPWFETSNIKLNKDKCDLLVSGNKYENVWIKLREEKIWESAKNMLGIKIGKYLSLDGHVFLLWKKAGKNQQSQRDCLSS